MLARGAQARRWVVLGAIAACFLYPFPYFERLNNPNENVRLYMTMAIAEEGTVAIDGPTRRFGWVNDRAERDGHLYAGKAPGASFLGVPAYAAARWVASSCGLDLDRAAALRVLRLAAVTLPTLALLLAFRRFLDEQPGGSWLRDAVLLAYGLGTMAYAYGMMFAGHQLAAVALWGGLFALYRAAERVEAGRRGAPLLAALGGLLVGAAPVMEYPAAVGAAVVFVYAAVVLRRRPLLVGLALASAALPLGGLLWFHAEAFGSPLAFPYDFIENPAFQRLLGEGWHGSTLPRLDRLATMVGAPSFGLFFFTPLFLLSPVGWVAMARAWRELPDRARHLAWALPTTALALLLYLASSALWRAGWAVGPRYIATAVPALALSACWGADAVVRRWPRGGAIAVAVLVLLSVLHSGTSGALYPHQPEPFDNPVYDLNLPLLRMGYAPHTLAEPLGLYGWPSLVPLAILAAIPCLLVAAGPTGPWKRRAGQALVVVGLTAAAALGLSRLGTDSPDEARMMALVRRTWEPRGHSIPEARRVLDGGATVRTTGSR